MTPGLALLLVVVAVVLVLAAVVLVSHVLNGGDPRGRRRSEVASAVLDQVFRRRPPNDGSGS